MDDTKKAQECVNKLHNITTELSRALKVYTANIPCVNGDCPFHETLSQLRCTKKCPYTLIHEDFLRTMHYIRKIIFDYSGDW